MEKYVTQLQKSSLFRGVDVPDLEKLCGCISAREKNVAKDSFIFAAGDAAQNVYLILSGSAHIIDEDFWGNRTIIETLPTYSLFGEAYAITGAERHLVSVVAAERMSVLEIDPVRLFEACENGCACHGTLIKNAAYILSEKIVRLTEKLRHVVRRTTREKILSYLSKCARAAQSSVVTIPYSRQQLADYLCVDRSALSHELSRLSRQGLISFRKNHFELLDIDEIF